VNNKLRTTNYKQQIFPKGFLWGSATSAHQVEGNNLNNWSIWEEKTANNKRLAAIKKEWPEHILKAYPSPLHEENYISGKAVDHYHRFKEDFDLARRLSHNAHRFSIEWSRIEPEEGKFNKREVQHYREVIDALKERAIEPFVTLYHWTIPVWFEQSGAWLHNDAPKYFERFVEKIVDFYPDVTFWITINEPMVYASNSFLKGIWPPQSKSLLRYIVVLRNLRRTHEKAYDIIHKKLPKAQVGIVKNVVYFEPHGRNPWNYLLALFANYFWNFQFLNSIQKKQDFIGVNYYFHSRVRWSFSQNENKKTSDMGWEIYPEGLYYILKSLRAYKKPLFITENGIADARDYSREQFIKDNILQIQKAMKESVDVRGYFYWSLLDNFEWDKGFWPRFGLVGIDYKTLKRNIRPSARVYKKIIEARG